MAYCPAFSDTPNPLLFRSFVVLTSTQLLLRQVLEEGFMMVYNIAVLCLYWAVIAPLDVYLGCCKQSIFASFLMRFIAQLSRLLVFAAWNFLFLQKDEGGWVAPLLLGLDFVVVYELSDTLALVATSGTRFASPVNARADRRRARCRRHSQHRVNA